MGVVITSPVQINRKVSMFQPIAVNTPSAGNLVKGDLAIVRIYSTALSSNIILNNFNVNRARFSI
jgi:hypothetical protein